jgi:hypothetical protein
MYEYTIFYIIILYIIIYKNFKGKYLMLMII